MNQLEVNEYIHEIGFISVRALAQKFSVEPEDLYEILESLENSGDVKRFDISKNLLESEDEPTCSGSACHRCKGCSVVPDPATQIVYQGL